MRKNLLEFLFGDAVIHESQQNLGEHVVKLFEEAADEETEEMVATKEPLVSALKSLGISADVEAVAQGCVLICDDPAKYREYVNILFNPENMHALAAKGWVAAKGGDVAMTFEPAEFKINFIEIATAETGDKDKAPDLEKVLKDAQKFAATEPDHDDDMNPVEFDDKTSKDHKKGVGDAKDGAAPEGKPKGSEKNVKESTNEQPRIRCSQCGQQEVVKYNDGSYGCKACGWKKSSSAFQIKRQPRSAKEVTDSLLDEMTSTAAVPAFEGPPPVMGNQGPDWKKRLAALRKRRGQKPDHERP